MFSTQKDARLPSWTLAVLFWDAAQQATEGLANPGPNQKKYLYFFKLKEI